MENETNKHTSRFTRNKTEDISNLIYGKIPPQARELEEAVLGAILIEKDAFAFISNILTPEYFYVDAHATIFRIMQLLVINSEPIDLLSVTERLRKEAKLEEVGGAFYLSELTNKIASSANVEYHARIIIQKFIQRELIRISNDIIRDSYEDTTDVFDLLDTSLGRIMAIANSGNNNIKSLTQVILKINQSIITDSSIAKIYNYGFCGFDTLTGTFNLIAGLQGTGKTAFLLKCAKGLATQGIATGILSVEMADVMLGARVLQTETGLGSKKIVSGTLTDQEKQIYFNKNHVVINPKENEIQYSDYIFIDECKGLNNQNICIRIRGLVSKYGVKVIFIDYAQLVKKIKKGNSNDVSYNEDLSNDLQQLAKELDISITALSQLAKTSDKPTINSIRGGGLEQAASDLWILHNENWQQDEGSDWEDIPEERRGKILFIDAKGRYSAVKNRYLYFDKPNQDYIDWNDKHSEAYNEYAKGFDKF